MNKKEYIQPTILVHQVTPSAMICGSGSETGNIPNGINGKEPSASGGIITGDAKSSFEFDPDEEE